MNRSLVFPRLQRKVEKLQAKLDRAARTLPVFMPAKTRCAPLLGC